MCPPRHGHMDNVVNGKERHSKREFRMNPTVSKQVAQLWQMSPAQLREKYLMVFGEPSRTGNKDFLCKRLAWRIQSLTEGGLSERAKRRAAELARDADIRMTMPKAQAVNAGASTALRPAHVASGNRLPIPGTVLTRQYKRKLIQVTVLPDGFDYDGTAYRSLSAVAKAVTGTNWNGYLFFGLKDITQ